MSRTKLGYDPWARWGRDSKSSDSFNPRKANVKRFFKHNNASAEKLLLLAGKTPYGKPQFAIEQMIERHLDWLDSKGYAPSTIAKEAGYITSFFRANNVNINIGRKKYPLIPRYEAHGPEGPRILKQKEVRSMIHSTKGKNRLNCLEKQAVICVEAQTAQRIGILPCLRFSMIRRYRLNGREYGVVTVMPDWPGNKSDIQYKFGLHWESMKLVDELKAQRKAKDDDFIWTMNVKTMNMNTKKRRMQEAVSDAAKDAGIQRFQVRTLKIKGKKKFKWSDIHAHAFRRFWVDRMYAAKALSPDFNDKLREHQLGHSLEAISYYWGMISDKKIIKAIKQADKELRVL